MEIRERRERLMAANPNASDHAMWLVPTRRAIDKTS
jgi:hypothetical protein